MCGIAGVLNLQGGAGSPALLEQMAERIRHRGPDAVGFQLLGMASLAHARLAIIDLTGGRQPMANEDSTLWISFSGEILNFVELRTLLVAAGHRFSTRSDTEVILHAYEEWGADCVTRFNGQWAFAIWDTRNERLFLSRDRFGIRPLYYTQTPRHFVFASEIKSIFCHPDVPREVDLEGLDQILTFWCPVAPRTFFKRIWELPAGHSLVFERGEARVFRYWEMDYAAADSVQNNRRSEADVAEELRALLIDAVRLRLVRSDVPVGAYVSGGLDSTIIASVVKKLTDTPIATFSVAFEDAEYDESDFQKKAIRALGVRDHHTALCRNEDIGRVFPDVVWHAEQPLVRTAPAPLYLLARLVRETGYRVVLTGEGADELFGGYDIFAEAKVRRFCARRPESARRPLLLKRLYPYLTNIQRQPLSYLKAFFASRPEALANPFFSHLPRWESGARNRQFYSDDVRQALAGRDPYAEMGAALPPRHAAWDWFSQAQHLETAHLLSGYILSSQGDRVAMAHGIEARFPFLDVRVAELAGRIPALFKMKGLCEKHILKKAMADLIPAFVARRPKQPYRAPHAACFFEAARGPRKGRARFDYVDSLLSPPALAESGVFHPEAVARLVERAKAGGVTGARDGMALVAILSTQLTIYQFISGQGRSLP